MSEKNSSPSIEHPPYSKIGDANPESAFLTNANGYDVAVLRRVLTKDVTPEHQTLSDEQWQKMINLIDAAPDLLKALRECIPYVQEELESCVALKDEEGDAAAENISSLLDRVNAAIAKTKLL